MKQILCGTVLCLSFVFFLGGCAAFYVKKTDGGTYRNQDNQVVKAEYYTLSDGSLYFVKLFFTGGIKATLPLAVSASGARYTDEFQYVWWIKGASATLETRNADGSWSPPEQYSQDTKMQGGIHE